MSIYDQATSDKVDSGDTIMGITPCGVTDPEPNLEYLRLWFQLLHFIEACNAAQRELLPELTCK